MKINLSKDLWLPMRGSVTDAKKNAWLQSRSITFHGFQEWQLPANQTWQEDPFANNTWKLWYHCLTWLYVPEAIFESNGDASQLEQVRHYTLDWMMVHAPSFMADPADMAWDDHATAYRSTFLVYLYKKYFSDDREWKAAFEATLTLHAQALHSFLHRPEFRGNNHGVFHCFALLNMAAALPHLTLPHYKTDAEGRLFELLEEMIDTQEGVTREQAIEYQFIALELVSEVIEYADFFDLSDENSRIQELHALMTRMVDFAFDMRWPDGSVPAVGDTWLYWNGWSIPVVEMIGRYIASGYGSNSTKQAYRRHLECTAEINLPNIALYPRSGYLLVSGAHASWAVFMKGGPSIHSHGHNDHLNIQFFLRGELLLVDSGGPYKYSDSQREYFTHPRAHNVIIPRGQASFPHGVAEGDISTVVTDAISHLGGKHRLSENLLHIRNAVLYHECETLVVIDEIEAKGALCDQDFEQFWHFPPGMVIKRLAPACPDSGPIEFELVAPCGSLYRARIVCNGAVDVTVVEGQVSPRLQGWITRNVGSMDAAPVLEVRLKQTSERQLTTAMVIWKDDGKTREISLPSRSPRSHSSFQFLTEQVGWAILLNSHYLVRAVRSDSDRQ